MIYLLSIIFNLLKAEPLVLYPSIIVSFMNTWLLYLLKININDLKFNNPVLIYLISTALLQVFNQLLVADLAKTYIQKKVVFFSNSFLKTISRFIPALLGINLILSIMTFLIFISRYNFIVSIITFPILLLLIIIFQILPIVYIISENSILYIFKNIYNFFTKKFRQVLFIIFFTLFIFIITFFLMSILNNLNPSIKAIFIPILQGIANTIIIYNIIILFSNHASFKVNTQA